jgi:small subunit ribosomal protein S16
MLKIKLKPTGKIHQRSFRIVISPDRSKSDGKFIDDIGFYTPQTKTLQIDKVKMAQWIKNGAQLTEGVDKLLNPDKYPRKKKAKNVEKTEKIIQKKEESKAEEKVETTETVPHSEPVEEKIEEKTEEVKVEPVKEEIPETKE